MPTYYLATREVYPRLPEVPLLVFVQVFGACEAFFHGHNMFRRSICVVQTSLDCVTIFQHISNRLLESTTLVYM